MSGISRIQKTRDDVKSPNPQDRNQSREIWFKDGIKFFYPLLQLGMKTIHC